MLVAVRLSVQVGEVRGGCGGGRREVVQASRGLAVPALSL